MPASVTAAGLPISAAVTARRQTSSGHAADLQGHVGGHDQAVLDGLVPRRLLLFGLLGQAVRGDDAVVGDGVVLQQLLEPGARRLRLVSPGP